MPVESAEYTCAVRGECKGPVLFELGRDWKLEKEAWLEERMGVVGHWPMVESPDIPGKVIIEFRHWLAADMP